MGARDAEKVGNGGILGIRGRQLGERQVSEGTVDIVRGSDLDDTN